MTSSQFGPQAHNRTPPSLTAILGGLGVVMLVAALFVLRPLFSGDDSAVSGDATHVYSLAFQTAAAADAAAVTGDPAQFAVVIGELEAEWTELQLRLTDRAAVTDADLAALDRALRRYLTSLTSYVGGDASATDAGQSLQIVASGMQQLIDNLAVTADAEQARESDARVRGSILIVLATLAFAAAVTRIQRSSQRAQQAAGERERLLSMAEGLSAGLITADATGHIDYLNTRAANLLALDPDTIVGAPLAAAYVGLAVPEDRRAALTAIPGTGDLADEEPFVVERTDDRGTVLDVSRFAIELNGRHTGTGHLVRDITREHEVDRMKTEFVAIASHELRTPLTGILGYSELLQGDADLNDRARGWAERVVDEAGRLSDIVEELLNITRIESGQLELKPELLELPPLLDEVHGHFTAGRHGDHHTLVLDQHYQGQVFADPGKLHEVLINLVDNAIKYSPEGGTVRIGIEEHGAAAVINISDEGIGIAEADLPGLFQRFQRVGGEDTATIRGTGLGLYIVKTFVEAMGGELTVASTLGEGSTFTVSLPRQASSAAA